MHSRSLAVRSKPDHRGAADEVHQRVGDVHRRPRVGRGPEIDPLQALEHGGGHPFVCEELRGQTCFSQPGGENGGFLHGAPDTDAARDVCSQRADQLGEWLIGSESMHQPGAGRETRWRMLVTCDDEHIHVPSI